MGGRAGGGARIRGGGRGRRQSRVGTPNTGTYSRLTLFFPRSARLSGSVPVEDKANPHEGSLPFHNLGIRMVRWALTVPEA